LYPAIFGTIFAERERERERERARRRSLLLIIIMFVHACARETYKKISHLFSYLIPDFFYSPNGRKKGFFRKTILSVKRWTDSGRETDGKNRLCHTGIRFLRLFAGLFRRASLTLRRASPTLRRTSLTLRRAFLTLRRASPTLRRASLTLRRAFLTLQRAPPSLLRVPPDKNGDRSETRFRANESTIYECIYPF
jgi:hypothetical protein